MGQEYIRTARAKGLTEFAVVTKHALRNALIPVITVLGPTVAKSFTNFSIRSWAVSNSVS